MSFDGVNDYVRIADPANGSLDPETISVALWVKVLSDNVNAYPCSKDRDCCDSPGQGGYGLRISANKVLAAPKRRGYPLG